MATINQYFEFALLAQSAYEDLSGLVYGDKDALKSRLVSSGNDSNFTAKQAELFTDGINGFSLRDHTPNDLFNGFSASLFESNANPGEFTLTLRGTEPTDPRDLLSDIDLGATGLPVTRSSACTGTTSNSSHQRGRPSPTVLPNY